MSATTPPTNACHWNHTSGLMRILQKQDWHRISRDLAHDADECVMSSEATPLHDLCGEEVVIHMRCDSN